MEIQKQVCKGGSPHPRVGPTCVPTERNGRGASAQGGPCYLKYIYVSMCRGHFYLQQCKPLTACKQLHFLGQVAKPRCVIPTAL